MQFSGFLQGAIVLLPLVQLAQPEARGDARQDYLNLALSLSHDYRLDNAQAAKEPKRSDLEKLAKSASEKSIQQAATMLMNGIDAAEKERLAARQMDEEQRRIARERLAAIERGEYVYEEEYDDVMPDGRVTRRKRVVDKSLIPFLWNSARLNAPDESTDPQWLAFKLRIATERSRSSGWDQVLPGVADRLAGPLSRQPLVAIKYLADGPGGVPISETQPGYGDGLPGREPFRGRYVARNLANRDLHNVTLAVEMFHYSTLPDPTLRHVYFIPLWKKDATVEFSRTFLPDPKRGGAKYQVSALETDASGHFVAISELSMMAGVVRMRSALWSDETRQAPTMSELPERANIVAPTLIKLAERRVKSKYAVTPENRPASPPGTTKGKSSEEWTQMMLEELARPVLAFMPANSEYARRAERLLKDFRAVRAELLANPDPDLLAACAEGKRYAGKWSTRSAAGEFGILFLDRDAAGKRIRAEVFDPLQPERRRLVAGFIARASEALQEVEWIMLEPFSTGATVAEPTTTTKKKGAEPPKNDTDPLREEIKSYRFKLGDGIGTLNGHTSLSELPTAAYGYDSIGFILQATAVDAKELAEAKKREQAAPREQPREAFAEVPVLARNPAKGMRPTPGQPGTVPVPAPAETTPRPPLAERNRTPLVPSRPAITPPMPGASSNSVVVDDVEYVYQGAARRGAVLIVTVLATSKQGDREAPRGAMTLVEADGRRFMGQPTGGRGSQAELKEGKPAKLTWQFGGKGFGGGTLPIPTVGKNVNFSSVSISAGFKSIEFRDVPASGK